MRVALVVLLLSPVVVCACSGGASPDPLPFEPASTTAAPEPSKRGPFPVGVRTVRYEDTGRRKPDGTPRVLVTELWYPATQETRGGPGALYDVKPLFTEEQQAAITAAVPKLETDAVRDAAPAKAHGPFPLVMFSHGQAAMRWQSTYLTVLLASHGYVVAAPDHEGGTLYDVVRGKLTSVTEGIDNRPLDLRYLVNRLSRLPAGDALEGVIDVSQLGVAGHSFGALTAMRVTVYDDRVKAIVPQTPVTAELAYVGHSNPRQVPIMLQGSKRDLTLPYAENTLASWELAKRPRWLFALETGGHFTYSDLCQFDLGSIIERLNLDLMGADVRKVLEDGCGPMAPPASVALPMIGHFTVGFFNAQLRGSAGSAELLTQAQADALGAGVAEVRADP